ncbi:cytochrome c family protein [Rhizobium deserti]|uniref:Cytochrome c family protein n=1 Tax=Rhizobium deserti TaxID=2547961 RepID=A0A4R5UHL9_9HYPH|nr:cytochrome c family protein [Rhizobium deserti]TDK35464.1 cytochrome c family protein [Rhizobium deserti]
MSHPTVPAWAALLAFAFTLPASAADLEHGKRVFRSCASCHAIETDRNGFGPHLKGVVGRKAGSLPDYNYSPAMRAAGESGLVWNEQALTEFLADPKGKVPGNKMRFWGLWKSESDDLIAYLKAHP